MQQIMLFMPMDIGTPEIIFIIIAVFILFGPKKLPKILKDVGNTYRKLRKTAKDFQDEAMRELDISDITKNPARKTDARIRQRNSKVHKTQSKDN